MTMPYERYLAVAKARDFMKDLRKDPNVFEEIRNWARHILRHYPEVSDMHLAAKYAPHVFDTEW